MRPLLTLHFVRHGETTANREGIIQGHKDYDLTPLGFNQAVATADRLRGNSYWQAYSSDLTRARRTAEVILEEHAEVTLHKTQLLRDASGRKDRRSVFPRSFRIKAEQAGVVPEDYVECLRESPADVKQRAQQFLDVLIEDALRAEAGTMEEGRGEGGGEATAPDAEHGEDGNPRLVLVVSHGGILNVMMLAVMRLKRAEIMDNGAVAVVDVYGRQGWVRYAPRTLNDSSHVDQAGR
ncbi:unnamed protein product, partial [Scytosiphon promiscuus]